MPKQKLAVIACGVLEWNIKRIAQRISETTFLIDILPAQLHQSPIRLREMLQDRIDRLEREANLEGIVIGYGVCGRGAIGLCAQSVPLILPRTQDCIGIYLGSHSRYIDQFTCRPGTRYLTHGWYEKTIQDRPQQHYMSAREHSLYGQSFEQLQAKYGRQNALYICEFRESWKRNYQRAAYIRFAEEAECPAGQQVSEGLAETLGWDHEVLDGDDSLLLAMLRGDWGDSRLLLVPPRNKTVSAPGGAVMGFAAGIESHVEAVLTQHRDSRPQRAVLREGIGLGVDTGGTFTDAVVFDFAAGSVLAQSKSPTTHGHLIDGIRNALQALPQALLRKVHKVGLSTTLATNAFVEGKGRSVAVFLMSPFTLDITSLPFRYVRKIDGCMSIEGEECAPIDPEQVRLYASEAVAAGCQAFAISGFGGVINPAHELEVAEIALGETGLHAVCGHELTSELNFMERATTAAINAKLIPLIEELLEAVREALRAIGLPHVKVMVVKGDGSQMLDRVARRFPVDTVLSGPAASVVGAARLFDHADAVVVDMGGTTLDVAMLKDHLPVLSDRGARVGALQTSVRAMAIRTIGLGGDSEIDLAGWPAVTIGPRRVIPLCRLAEHHPGMLSRLPELLRESVACEPNCMDLVALAEGVPPEGRIPQHLASGPLLLGALARRMNRVAPAQIAWRELESEGKLVRYGLTLTDVLHYEQRYTAFNRAPAEMFLTYWSLLLNTDVADIVGRIHQEFRRMVCDTVLEVALPDSCPWADRNDPLRRWLTDHFAGKYRSKHVSVQAILGCPLVAVGAPAPTLFPEFEPVLHQDVLISEHAGVANAVGAIAGDVLLRETAVVRVTGEGALVCSWRGETARAALLGEALERCEQALMKLLREEAKANDIPFSTPHFTTFQHQAESRDGTVFFGVTLQGELRG